MSTPRRHVAGTEKVAILKRHLIDKVPVSDPCDELDLCPTQFHAWLKEFFENGHAAFDNGRKAKAVSARAFLERVLAAGPKAWTEVVTVGEAAGLTPGTPRAARQELGLVRSGLGPGTRWS